MEQFYVYALIDSRDGEVFYVGRGKNNRAWAHTRPSLLKDGSPKSNKIKNIISDSAEVITVLIYENLSFQDSLNREKELISFFGKENLTNRTAGGQGQGSGVKGFLGKRHTLESRKLLAASKRGSKNPMAGDKWHRSEAGKKSFSEKISGENHPMFGKKRPEEIRKKISSKLKGMVLTPEQKMQRSESMKEVWRKRRDGLIPERQSRNSKKQS